MRVIGGCHRGRALEAPCDRAIRPTSDRTREALFNILTHADWPDPVVWSGLAGARVLDACCGAGTLGIEALSRGADHVLFLDQAPSALALVGRNLDRLGERRRATLIRGDVRSPPAPAAAPVGLCLIDPPYDLALAGPSLAALAARGWLAPGCLVALEHRIGRPPAPTVGLVQLDQRRYGDTMVTFLGILGGADVRT